MWFPTIVATRSYHHDIFFSTEHTTSRKSSAEHQNHSETHLACSGDDSDGTNFDSHENWNLLFPEPFGHESSSSRQDFQPKIKLPRNHPRTTRTTQKHSWTISRMILMLKLRFPRHLEIIISQHFGNPKTIT